MKKFLLVFVFLFSVGMLQAQTESCTVDNVKTVISKADLPIGSSFVLMLFDGTPIVSGVIDSKLLERLPIGRKFALSVDGVVTEYSLIPIPPRIPKE